MKKFLALFLVLAMALSMAACGAKEEAAPAAPAATEAAPAATEAAPAATEAAPAEPAKLLDAPLTFKVAYVENPDTAMGIIAPKYFDLITERTNGELQFEYFPSGLLGTNADYAEQIANGAPIIGTVGMASLSKVLEPLATPYVLESIEETLALPKTEYYQKGVEDLKSMGYMPICAGSLGIRHIISTKEVKSSADFEGLIIRMAATPQSQGFASVQGGTPITNAWADCYGQLETGAIDATEAPIDLLYSSALYEVCDYLCMSAHLTTPFQFVMSTTWWDQIPAEYQQIVLDTLAEGMVEMADMYAAADAEYVDKFKAEGVTVCEDPDIASFAACLPALFESLEMDVQIYNDIRASIDAVM